MAQINPDNGRIYLDNTILMAVAECDTKALMRHGFDFTSEESTAPLLAGQAAHEALAHFFKRYGRRYAKGKRFGPEGGAKLIEECLAVHEAHYGEWAREKVAEGDRLSLGNTMDVLRGWLVKHVNNDFPFTIHPELVEIGFAIPLDTEGRFVFCGRLDALVETADGWYVLDHKTTGRMDSLFFRKFRLGSQFSGYQWAATMHLHKPVIGSYVNAIEFAKLPGPGEYVAPRLKKDGMPYKTRECATHSTNYSECRLQHVNHDLRVTTRTPEALETWRQTAIALAKRFARLMEQYPTLTKLSQGAKQQGMFNNGCQWCDFQDFCGTGRPAKYVRGMFKHEPWKPFDYAFPAEGETMVAAFNAGRGEKT